MKTLLLVILLLFSTNIVSSQTDSPVGKWILTEHIVIDSFDPQSDTLPYRNVLTDEFKASLTFEPDGKLIQQFGDTTIVGNWKLKGKGKKLKLNLKYDIYAGHTLKFSTPINFETPLVMEDYFRQLYTANCGCIYGGISKYDRVSGEAPKIEKSLLLGKWKTVKFKKRNKETVIHDPDSYEFGSDQQVKRYNEIGEWKINGNKLTMDFRSEYPNDFPHLVRTVEIKKITREEMIYLEKIGKKSRLVYLEKM